MKIFALFFAIFALVSSATALKNDICGLKHSMNGYENGRRCMARLPSWSYKADTNECVEFNYGGCEGNGNRFKCLEECETMCKE